MSSGVGFESVGFATATSRYQGVGWRLVAMVDATPVESIKIGIYNDCNTVFIYLYYSTAFILCYGSVVGD